MDFGLLVLVAAESAGPQEMIQLYSSEMIPIQASVCKVLL